MSETTAVCAVVPRDQPGLHPLVYGMGILVANREVVTCAHVVAEQFSWRDEEGRQRVRVCFPFTDCQDCVDATVDPARYFPRQPGATGVLTDTTVLVLDRDAPADVSRATLGEARTGHPVQAYGFRSLQKADGTWLSHPSGEHAQGIISGALPGGRVQFDGLRTGRAVERGFSGAGVYDSRRDTIVGMVVEADEDTETKVAQFIDAPSLEKAWKPAAVLPPADAASVRTVSKVDVAAAEARKDEIETYLQSISHSLPPVEPDQTLLPYVEKILNVDSADAALLRRAFGFPSAYEESRLEYGAAALRTVSARPILASFAQRISHLLWRYDVTLAEIRAPWAGETSARVQEIKTICEPFLVAHRPTPLDMEAALTSQRNIQAFTESAPDDTLYAVMRALDHPDYRDLPPSDVDGHRALAAAWEFQHAYLLDLVEGNRSIDDSSNAWWALRMGIVKGDGRFRALLGRVAEKYGDIRIPAEEVKERADVPEIYNPVRTTAYTLSNVQAIVEEDGSIEEALKDRLHWIIHRMLGRLLKTPRSDQLYLASVHHEGLRNYLDYVRNQQLPVV